MPRLTPAAAVRAMEEAITLVRALSGGGAPVTFHGEFYQVRGIIPAPVQAPAVWTGSVGPKSLAVTGRLADGWVPGRAADWLGPDYIAARRHVDAAAEAAGRDPGQIATIFNLPGQITRSPLPATRDRVTGRWAGGSPAQWIQELTAAVLERGAAGFLYFSPDGTPSDVQLGRWAEEIVPAVREAIAKSLPLPVGRNIAITVRKRCLRDAISTFLIDLVGNVRDDYVQRCSRARRGIDIRKQRPTQSTKWSANG